jgi:hypothetical protein
MTEMPKAGDPWVVLMSRLVVMEGIVSGLLSLYLAAAQQNSDAIGVVKTLWMKIALDIEVGLQGMPPAVAAEARVSLEALRHRMETQLGVSLGEQKQQPN